MDANCAGQRTHACDVEQRAVRPDAISWTEPKWLLFPSFSELDVMLLAKVYHCLLPDVSAHAFGESCVQEEIAKENVWVLAEEGLDALLLFWDFTTCTWSLAPLADKAANALRLSFLSGTQWRWTGTSIFGFRWR